MKKKVLVGVIGGVVAGICGYGLYRVFSREGFNFHISDYINAHGRGAFDEEDEYADFDDFGSFDDDDGSFGVEDDEDDDFMAHEVNGGRKIGR